MWIEDHIDIADCINCPHCGAELALGERCLWQLHWCPVCLETITLDELQDAIKQASLTWIPDS